MTRTTLARALQLALLGFASNAAAQNIDLGNLGERGFRIIGAGADDTAGLSVSGAGDVNGDGLADLIVGAPQHDPGGRPFAGTSYVVFGKADDADVDLASLGSQGFRIDGAVGSGGAGSCGWRRTGNSGASRTR